MTVDSATSDLLGLDRERLLRLYRQMLEIRRTEEALARAYLSGQIHGACHTYVGEEAIATGVCAHLRPADAIASTHRGHGHALAKGVAPRAVAAELFGRATGCSQGRGGSMHLFAPEVGLLGTSGIVGPSIGLATGAGYAFKLRGSDNVGVAFFGDGASNNGIFHEALGMAAVWKLPVLYVCENNQYATEVPFTSVAAKVDIAARGAALGVTSVTLDGNDVLAIYEAAGAAVRRARAGDGPSLLVCTTYRTRPHSEGMRDTGYRTQAEIDAWKGRDPIHLLRQRLLAASLATEAALTQIEQEVLALAEDAIEFAHASPWPDPATATDHVFAGQAAGH